MTYNQKIALILVVAAVLFILLACGNLDPTGISPILRDLADATPAPVYP